eukprot:bmy_07466T0
MPLAMTVYALVVVSYFLITGGIIYDVTVKPPSVSSVTNEHGHQRPVAFLACRKIYFISTTVILSKYFLKRILLKRVFSHFGALELASVTHTVGPRGLTWGGHHSIGMRINGWVAMYHFSFHGCFYVSKYLTKLCTMHKPQKKSTWGDAEEILFLRSKSEVSAMSMFEAYYRKM